MPGMSGCLTGLNVELNAKFHGGFVEPLDRMLGDARQNVGPTTLADSNTRPLRAFRTLA